MDSLARFLSKKEFEDISVQDIADEAHLTPETVIDPDHAPIRLSSLRCAQPEVCLQRTASAAGWFDENGAYAHIQGTRPYTPAYALNDSPAGLAAWIVEKFREWSDCEGDVYRSFTRDELLGNVTLYWMTQTIASSFRMYYEGRKAPLCLAADDFVHVPCGIACLPKEISFPPKEWVERGYNIQRWTDMPKGGHFAAAEQPDLLAADIRAFFRPLRQ
jgi:pimeloyl-ACP methyl ester carboxylesterase